MSAPRSPFVTSGETTGSISAVLCIQSVDIKNAVITSAPQRSVLSIAAPLARARACVCVDANVVFVCGGGPFLPFTDNLLDRLLKPRPKPTEQLEPLRD